MAQDSNSERSKAKVPLKVTGPHVVAPATTPGAPEMGENSTKARKGAIFLAGVIGVYVVFLVATGQMGEFLSALSKVDTGWVMWAAFAFVLYFAFGVLAYVIAVYLDHESPVGVRDLMSVEASGVFFGNLTPMMAGAVPSQIYRLTRTGLDVGEASATQFTRFIMFQLGVVLFAAIMLFAKLSYFFQTYGDIIILNLVVFAVHFLELAGLFVVCLCPRLVIRVGNRAIRLADSRHWLKDRSHWDEMVNVQVMEFSDAFKRAAQDVPSMLLTLVVTMAQLACLYMIPWFVLRAFGIQADFVECLAAGSMVQMVASAVPLPGGTGGAEGGFVMFYGHMFGPSTSAGFLVWRIVTFFGPTLLATPLLGLRSRGGRSIYRRVQSLRDRLASVASGRRGGGHGRGGGSVTISMRGSAGRRG
ncbi:lysylphosphatidylglycerol synthase transmembrane domain-containing protein [Olsenella phocaeensis]|uniref:lysylphosphatidylglycerol synthase transmembrane domain-containing protein n=1 Tax=Olsenella phocaeensis TaxID=1852385 RepID=UPI003A8C9D39